MIEGHWFTTIGMSPHAVYNTLWMAYIEHDWHPAKITVFRLTPSSLMIVSIKNWIRHIKILERGWIDSLS
jgi:hypothetical protein